MEFVRLGLLVLAGCAAALYWLRFCTRDDPGDAGALLKTVSTGALAAILWSAVSEITMIWLIALGLTLGAIGDWFLTRRGETAFLAGMAAFGAGHLAYAGGLLWRSSVIGFDGFSIAEWAGLVGLLLLALSTEVWLAPRTGALRWPVRIYVLVITVLGVVAVILPAAGAPDVLRWGVALFLASDLMLALRLFVVTAPGRQRWLSLTLWPAYWLGQALIGYGAILFWMFPKA